MVGRGAVNQKGPQTAFLTVLHGFKAAGVKLPVNLVLVAEGEEEIGSTNFAQLTADPEVRAALKRSVGIIDAVVGPVQVGRGVGRFGRQGRDRSATGRRAARNGAAARPRTSTRA